MSNVMAEKKFRISSDFDIQCSICSRTNHISTSTQHRAGSRGTKAFDANSRVSLAALDIGIGFSHVNSILTAHDVQTMTRKTYKAREREVGKRAEWLTKETCKVKFDKECELVKENRGTVDSDAGADPDIFDWGVQTLVPKEDCWTLLRQITSPPPPLAHQSGSVAHLMPCNWPLIVYLDYTRKGCTLGTSSSCDVFGYKDCTDFVNIKVKVMM